MTNQKCVLSLAAAAFMAFSGAAWAGSETVPNNNSALPTSVGAAIASMLNAGSSGTITLTTGEQIFVSASGAVAAVSSQSVASDYFDTGRTVYSGTSPTIAGFLASFFSGSGGTQTEGRVARIVQ